MIRKLMLALGASLALGFTAGAQSNVPCATDEFYKQQIALHPKILLNEQRLNADIERILKSGQVNGPYAAKGANNDSDAALSWPNDTKQYHIPMVVHIIYEGANTVSTSISDNEIYNMVTRLNTYYNSTDPALNGIINSFKPYIGNAHVTFHLATKDPNGKPTRGIVRQYSYASNYGDENAKIDQWPPDQYLNLYLENIIGRGATKGIVLAYATFPSSYTENIYSQGVISRADQALAVQSTGDPYTIAHEIGHFLSLYHVWNSNGQEVESTVCGDDEVDDTPPTRGHFSCSVAQLYDTVCSNGYFKDYDSVDYYHMTALTGDIASNRVATTGSVTYVTDSINIVGQSFAPDTTDFLQNISVRTSTDSRSGDITTMSLYKSSNGVLVGTSTNQVTIAPGQILTYNFNVPGFLLKDTSYRFVINRVSGGNGLFSFDMNDSNKYTRGTMLSGPTAGTPISGSDLYFTVAGAGGKMAANTTSNKTVRYNSTFAGPNVIGQTITMGTAGVAIRSIKLLFGATSLTGDSVSMSIYSAGGALVATSDVRKIVTAGDTGIFTFQTPVLTANKTYKFVLNRVKGAGVFSVQLNNTNPYAGGVMYTGVNANTPVSGSDLYFDIAITRLRRFDYADTNNTQNIMDYSGCNNEMFSKGQTARMRATLRSDVGNRNNLITDANLARTGVLDTVTGNFITPPDITPTALFTVNRNFTCQGSGPITFTNRSYNDTIASANWTFDKGADITSSQLIPSVAPTFNDTGWVTATLTVTGNGNPVPGPGSSTYTRKDLVYVADANGINPYIEEFNPGNQLGKFPIFNYFDNPNYRWELYKAGVFDFTSIRFKNYDMRDKASVLNGLALNTATQSPRGLYADFYTPAYNLADPQFANKCFLSFFSAGAFRTTKPNEMNDSLLISYSADCGQTWSTFPSKAGILKYGDLANNGYRDDPFVPNYNEWKEHSITLPIGAKSAATYFRFRYFPGTDNAYLRYGGLDFGTGNNFYLDRLTVTANPLGVVNGVIVKLGMSVQPNPTSGAATIRLNGGDNSMAEVNVTDITGKLVFHTSAVRKAATTEIEIPASAIAVKGMYLVHVVTNGATQTQKLVAY